MTLNNHCSIVSTLRLLALTALLAVLPACATTNHPTHDAALSPPSAPDRAQAEEPMMLHVQPRYYRLSVDPGVPWDEKHTGYAHLDWDLPTHRAAIVLLDVWDRFYLSDTEARTDRIVRQTLAPLVKKARAAGIQIIHAPSPQLARKQPQWVGKHMSFPPKPTMPFADWPPKAFKQRTGQFAKYAWPDEPRRPERVKLRQTRRIHPAVRPQPGDVVVANGDELNQYCKDHGILFLFYGGFWTNACMLTRNYGPRAMDYRGFASILVRDATTAIEAAHTKDTLAQTHNATLILEMFGVSSVTSQQIIDGLHRADADPGAPSNSVDAP